MIVLDTNVLSELLKPKPAEALEAWIARRDASLLFTTAVTEAEMLLGVALMAAGKRRTALSQAIAGLFDTDLAGRVLPFDSSAAHAFAGIASERRRAGHPISQHDAQIAAIARCRGASIATRNVTDFRGCGIEIENPFEPGAL